MSELSLEAISSYVRDLSSACSAVILTEDFLVAGSHDGLLICWEAAEGIERWRVSIDGPISDIYFDSDKLYVTASASLYAIDNQGGSIVWSNKLEGASDYVIVVDGSVWATSSIYELEVADFIESSIWRFDYSGNELDRWVISERPWHLASDGDGGILLGLGRPRCGYLRVRPGVDLQHIPLSIESPITCGAGDIENILFGHSNGGVSSILSKISEHEHESLVTAIAVGKNGWISGHDDGKVSMESNASYLPGSIDSVEILETIGWASSYNDSRVNVMILSDEEKTLTHDSRIRQMHSLGNYLALGDDKGRIFMIELEVMQRRLNSSHQAVADDSKKSDLRAKLRMLRNR